MPKLVILLDAFKASTKNVPASTENLPLEIIAVKHTPFTKYLGPN